MVFQSLFLLQLLLLFSLTTPTAKRLHTIHPRLSPIGPRVWLDHPDQNLGESVREDFETFSYNQTLDHFNYRPESYDTFSQRYLINSKYWGGSGTDCSAPIFVYLGAEAPINGSLDTIGFLVDTAVHFKSLLAYVEHRYYGESIPFGEEAFKNASTLGYFNSAQAIADYAEIIIDIKKTFQAENAPVIVIGGSYGGMLASWLRLKYPHIALGALASSAPVLYFDDITPQDGFYSIVSKGFREASETCYQTIRKSWEEIDEVASKPDGLSELSKRFNTCNPLTYASELKTHLLEMYISAAQYNAPPTYPVNKVCGGIDGGGFGDDVLGKIFHGLVAYKGNRSCYVNAPGRLPVCITWGVEVAGKVTIAVKMKMEAFTERCKQTYGVPPRVDWVTSYYGGHNISLVLQRFGSNIIYSNVRARRSLQYWRGVEEHFRHYCRCQRRQWISLLGFTVGRPEKQRDQYYSEMD
ncbi:PROTEASE S28 PRO-X CARBOXYPEPTIDASE-RELATED [Salix koriyanagi]|uniref:PROTEASE S28 PRO-X CARBOXYPEPTIDASE-RELATED n=1 Tax=Salix koriyanagi TaxID=2511006 RepID=A0A9Q0YZD9_9ROSI|nr:PROTEASE S28 PRO-X CARBOXYPEPTIDASE-RELATED [Salix koriyanagi]